VIEHLPSKLKTLSSKPSTAKKRVKASKGLKKTCRLEEETKANKQKTETMQKAERTFCVVKKS
jgi:hypothetical protein